MQVSKISIKNVLGIEQLDLQPGKITVIEGGNGKGKTSTLEAIQKLFVNNCERNNCFVKTGADKSEIKVVLDDNTNIKKTINNDGKVNVNIEKEGGKFKSPETFLKSLVSQYQLNPIDLLKLNQKDFNKLILQLMPVVITNDTLKEWGIEIPINYTTNYKDFIVICKELETMFYDKRAINNKLIKTIENNIKVKEEQLPFDYDADIWRKENLRVKFQEIQNAHNLNNEINKHENNCLLIQGKLEKVNIETNLKIKQKEDKIKELLQDIENLNVDCIKQKEDIELQNVLSKDYILTHNKININKLETDYNYTEEMISFIKISDSINDEKKNLKELVITTEKIDTDLKVVRNKPNELLSTVRLPINNLTIVNGEILINERPINNLSGGERLKLTTQISKILSGELKLLLINGFESLSKEEQEIFIDECKFDDFQYIIVNVTDGELIIKDI
jgi:exonuclease SbcC